MDISIMELRHLIESNLTVGHLLFTVLIIVAVGVISVAVVEWFLRRK